MKKKILYIILTLRTIKNIWVFFLDYFHLLKGELHYFTYNNLQFFARSGSTDVGEIIIICSDLEYPKKYFPIKKNAVILDVGANIGAFTVYVNKILRGKKPKIYSIEPSKDNYFQLLKNIKLNKLKNIHTSKNAITKSNKRYYLGSDGNFDSFQITNSKIGKNVEVVIGSKIEDYCRLNKIKKIDFLKIDIEGGEHDLFDESLDYLNKHVETIVVEVHDISKKMNIDSFKETIAKSNFNVINIILGRTFILKNSHYHHI